MSYRELDIVKVNVDGAGASKPMRTVLGSTFTFSSERFSMTISGLYSFENPPLPSPALR